MVCDCIYEFVCEFGHLDVWGELVDSNSQHAILVEMPFTTHPNNGQSHHHQHAHYHSELVDSKRSLTNHLVLKAGHPVMG